MTELATSGLRRNERHQYWWMDIGPLPSITTLMKAVDKSGPLVGWAQRETAAAAVRNLDLIRDHMAHRMPKPECPVCMTTPKWEGPATAATAWLKRMPGYQRDASADLGTRVHALAEAIAHQQAVVLTEDEAPRVMAYRAWEEEARPKYIASEYMVCSLGHGYAGTGDLVVEIKGIRWRLDIKTGGYYAETGLQLAAAHYAEFSGRPGDPKKYRVPAADRCGVLSLPADGPAVIVPYDVTEETFQAFLDASRLWAWLQGQAKSIVGPPLTGGKTLDVAA